MIYTDQGTRVPWDWCPLAFANGIEWGAQGYRYERLYVPLYRWTAPLCWMMYLTGFIVGLFWSPAWTTKQKPKHFQIADGEYYDCVIHGGGAGRDCPKC